MPATETIHVLVVEDDPTSALLARRRLERFGYKVQVAEDGVMALEYASTDAFDVLVVDYEMPRLNGIELISALRAWTHPPPVVMVSGHREPELIIKAMKLGAADYLVRDPGLSYLDLLPAAIERALETWRLERTLAHLKARYEAVFKSSPAIQLILDPEDGRLVDANEAASAFYGYGAPELRRMRLDDLVGEDAPAAKIALKRAALGTTKRHDGRHRLASGKLRDVEMRLAQIEVEGRLRLHATVLDVTERRIREAELHLAEIVFQASANIIIISGANGLIVRVNPACIERTGYSADELIGQSPSMLYAGANPDDAPCNQAFKREFWEGEVWQRSKAGTTYLNWVSISMILNSAGEPMQQVCVASDITERKSEEKALHRRAFHDPLTDLANRALFQDRLERDIARAKRDKQRLALLFIDLDHFKAVNDTMGHSAGDALLKVVATRMQNSVRRFTDTVARLGGDEFAVILPDISEHNDALTIAQALVDAVRAPYTLKKGVANISASAGLVFYPDDAETIEALLELADQTMYGAKRAGRDRVLIADKG